MTDRSGPGDLESPSAKLAARRDPSDGVLSPRLMRCRVVGCEATSDSDDGFRAVSAQQFDALRALHLRVGNEVDAGRDKGRRLCFCSNHRSSAAELLGELTAEVPAPNASAPYRVGVVDHLSLSTSTRSRAPAPVAPEESLVLAMHREAASFSELFSATADGLRYAVRWYGCDGAPWLDDPPAPPPIGAATSIVEHDELERGRALYEGMRAFYEHSAASKAWRLAPMGDIGRYARRNTAVLGSAVLDWFSRHPKSLAARAGILAFQLLVLAVAAVCLWSLWISHARADLHLSASLSAGAIAVLSTTISMLEIINHLQNVHSPELQTYVVRILFIVPVFSVDCWLSLRFANAGEHRWTVYFDAVRDAFEAFTIYTFANFLAACFTGDESLCRVLAAKPQQEHLFGLKYVLRAPKMGREFMLFCRYGTLQFVIIKSTCAIAEVVLHSRAHATGEHSHPFSPRHPYLYITIAINLSQMVALYALLLFYHALHTDLAPLRPLGKFMSVKLIVFFTFWQSIAISLAVRLGLIHSTQHWGVHNISAALNNYLLVLEMLVAACLHTYVFSHRDFMGSRPLVQERRLLRRFDSMVLEVVSPKRLLVDTRDMLGHCLTCACCCPQKGAGLQQLERTPPHADLERRGGLRSRALSQGPAMVQGKPGSAHISRASTLGFVRTPGQEDVTASVLGNHRSALADEPTFADPLTGQPYQDASTDSPPRSEAGDDAPCSPRAGAPAAAISSAKPQPASLRLLPPTGASGFKPGQLV